MPTKLGERITSALLDRKVSQQDVTELISAAKAEKKFTPELSAELKALLTQHRDAFEPLARGALETFLSSTSTTVDLADPQVLTKHATSVAWNPVGSGGSLYVDGINFDDVVQGSIADCYMVSAFASLAQQDPAAIEQAITDNHDGTWDVRFFELGDDGEYTKVTVKVDSDLPIEFGPTAKYGKARDPKEAWVSMLEKAYAQWKGGYEAIGNGGNSGDVFEALTGRSPTFTSTTYTPAERLFSQMTAAIADHKPVTAGTHGKDSGVDYTGTGVFAWHAYSMLGTSEEAGVKYVQLRNPWGRTEPGSDGKDDGVFKMKLDDFMKLYNSVNIGG